jgi:hypothetical protein
MLAFPPLPRHDLRSLNSSTVMLSGSMPVRLALMRKGGALFITVLTLSSCAPNREQWMNQAAQQQVKVATGSIGSPDTVRAQAAQGAVVLNGLAAVLLKSATPAQQPVAAAFANDPGEISSGLHAIAETHDDTQFTSAVFSMCQPVRREAAPRVGHALLIFAGGIQTSPPPNMGEQDRANAISYLSTFGERLIDVPAKCDQAGQQLTEASAQEQQAEITHAQNVDKALTAAAVVFMGTAMVAGEVGAAAATRPPVVQQNNYYYGPNYGQ